MTMTIKRVAMGFLVVAMLAGAQPLIAAQGGTVSRVGAFATDSWRVWVSAGWHEVIVDGDRSTDLDLYIYNAAGQLLDADDDDTDYCIGRFFMPRGGYIVVRVRNLGSVYNDYEISVQ